MNFPRRIREDHKCPSCGDVIVVTMTLREGMSEPSAVWLESKPSISAVQPTLTERSTDDGSATVEGCTHRVMGKCAYCGQAGDLFGMCSCGRLIQLTR